MTTTAWAALGIALLAAACGDDVPPPAPDEAALSPEELLGKRLFEDPDLSEPRGQACASCHLAARAFAGDGGAVARGSRPDQLGSRNVPTAMYASFSPPFGFVAEPEPDAHGATVWTPTGGQFWDGRAADLAAQALGPFLNPREMNNPDAGAVIAKVRAASYAPLVEQVFGAGALDDAQAYAHLGEAIAAFEDTPRFHPFSSRFDAFLRGDGALDAHERRGLALFEDPDKGNCISCHAGDPSSHDPRAWLFTDFTYDALGVPRNPAIPDNADPSRFDLGLCAQDGLAARAPAGFDVSGVCGAFKVPTLRNVARTAPYFHNGRFDDLHDVVRFYVTRDTDPARWYPAAGGAVDVFDDLPPADRGNVNTTEVPYDRGPGDAPRLTDDEIDDVVAFLEALSDR